MQPTPLVDSKRIRRQLKYDLIGKDSYRGITLSYAYLANQVGHFALAFAPASGIYLLLCKWAPNLAHPGLWAGLGMSLLWIGFEVYNIWKQFQEGKGNDGKYVFAPDNRNIITDTAIDMGYFTFGGTCFAAGSTPAFPWLWLIPIGLLFFLLYISRSWYITKICQQTANYPFQLRLSQWNHPLSPANKAKIEAYHTGDKKGIHVLLCGKEGSGKTALAVALANEQSIKRYGCVYTTGTKLLSAFYDTDETIRASDPFALCTWRTADCLVVDDINPGSPITEQTIPATMIDKHMRALAENLGSIRQGNIIWVLGDADTEGMHSEWVQWLSSIGVSASNMVTINLG